jgi:hypothetical protein
MFVLMVMNQSYSCCWPLVICFGSYCKAFRAIETLASRINASSYQWVLVDPRIRGQEDGFC